MNKKRLGIIFFLILLIAIPVVVFLSQQQQDTRQRASEVQYAQPTDYNQWPVCPFPDPGFVSVIPGIKGCVGEGSVNGKGVAKITNTSAVAHKVGIASYKAFKPYAEPNPWCSPKDCPEKYDWTWTQELYDSKDNVMLNPGQTVYLSVNVPNCAWQVHIFSGNTLPKFSAPDQWYAGQNRLIDNWFDADAVLCAQSGGTQATGSSSLPTIPLISGAEDEAPSGIIRADMLE